jgi:hypothetical protein
LLEHGKCPAPLERAQLVNVFPLQEKPPSGEGDLF